MVEVKNLFYNDMIYVILITILLENKGLSP